MLAPELTAPESTALPALNPRLLARRLALPVALVAAAVVGVLLGAGQVHVFADTLRRLEAIEPGWVIAGLAFESISLIGYVLLLSLVAGRVTRGSGSGRAPRSRSPGPQRPVCCRRPAPEAPRWRFGRCGGAAFARSSRRGRC